MKTRITLAALAVVVITAGVVFPASAATASSSVLDPTKSWDLWQYALTIKGSQLQASMGEAANAAWSAQSARQAAASASYFSVGQINGVVPFDKMGEIIPLKEPVSPIGSGRKLGPIRLPAFPLNDFTKVTPGGATGATVGITAFMFRGDISQGVLGWFGVDANAAVCANDVFGQSGSFLNFLTGQDCSMYGYAEDFTPNEGEIPKEPGWVRNAYNAAQNLPCAWVVQGSAQGRVGTFVFTTTGTCNGTSTSIYAVNPVPRCKNTTTGALVAPDGTAWTSTTTHTQGTSGTGTGTYAAQRPVGAQVTNVITCPIGTAFAVLGIGQPTSDQPRILESGQYFRDLDGWPLYFGPGATVYSNYPGNTSDPERHLECTLTFDNGTTATASTSKFKESQGAYPSPNCPAIPAGRYPVNTKVELVGGTPSRQTIYDEDADDAYLDWQENDASRCANTDCVLDLVYVPSGLSCFGMGDQCNGWFQSPTRNTDYKCVYGGEDTALQDCYVYAQLFDPVKRLDGNPYSDPKTGDEIGTQTGRRYDEQLMGRPLQELTPGRVCGGSGTVSINPLDFVLRPIQCALEWAFVARPALVSGYGNDLKNQWNTRAPGQLATMVLGWSFAPSVSGCSITTTYLPAPGESPMSMTVLDACSGPMATVASISRFVVSVAFTVMVFLAVKRAIGKQVDYA